MRLRFGKDSFEVNPRYLKRNAVRVGGLVKPLPAQKYMNASIAVQDAGLADLLDPVFEGSLSGATRFVVIGGCIDQEHTAGSSDRYIPVAAHLINELAAADKLQSFRRRAA